MEYITTNTAYDFYIYKAGKLWYAEALNKGTNIHSAMAGFTTKKAAKHCAEVWQGWMH